MLTDEQIAKIRAGTPRINVGYDSIPVLDAHALARAIEAAVRAEYDKQIRDLNNRISYLEATAIQPKPKSTGSVHEGWRSGPGPHEPLEFKAEQ